MMCARPRRPTAATCTTAARRSSSGGFRRDTVLTSLFAARRLDYAFRIDSDITELNLSVANAQELHHQWSEELTVTSERAGVRWTGGIFLFRDVDRFRSLSEFTASGLRPGSGRP